MGLESSVMQCSGLTRKILQDLHIEAASLPDPDNCARCNAEVRHHHGTWIALSGGFVIDPYSGHARLLPDNSKTVGSTNDWLALGLGQKYCTTNKDDDNQEVGRSEHHVVHNYVLHNPFSNRSLPLTELDAVVVEDRSLIRKFLMRSTVDDFITVITNNRKHPIIVFQRGKGVWSPEPWETPYIYIIDIAFLGDKLYGITMAEDLIPLDLALDGDGRPRVTMGTHVIKQSHGHDYDDTTFDKEGDDDDDDQNQDEENEEDDNDAEDDDEEEDNDLTHINCSLEFDQDGEPDDIPIISRHLIESCGKLLMVRHRRYCHPDLDAGPTWVTVQVDVFEADFNTHAWVPLTEGLGGGRALFLSMKFSKSVPAPCGEVEEDAIYFMDTGNVFNMKSGASNPSKFCEYPGTTWLFPSELIL
ncbi:hypothetical protein ACQJBY_030211 [Aegilops geniculata]